MNAARRNDPCPCGSGKKYRNCCYRVNYIETKPAKKTAYFTEPEGFRTSAQITSIDAIPT